MGWEVATAYLTSREIAERLRLSRGTIENWRYLGKGPPWVKIEGSIRYPVAEFDKWLSSKEE